MGPFIAVLIVIGVVAGAYLLGRRLPVRHRVSGTVDLPVPPERLWRAITDPASARAGGTAFQTTEAQPPRRLVRQVVGESSFGGTWTYVIEDVRNGSRLSITEDGEVYNPFFRFMSRYVIGQRRTMDSYFAELRRQIGSR